MKKIIKTTMLVCLSLVLFVSAACSDKKGETVNFNQYEKVFLNASWAYNYESVRELAENCDLAAYVSIKGWENDDEYSSLGVNTIIYTAEICESLYGKQQGTIRIVMTGKIDEQEKKIFEIADDPLMKPDDKFFIFARANEDGTYTVLSGSQGRFEIADGMVSSLNVCNEPVAESNSDSNIKVNNLPRDDFYAQIKTYLKQ